jgi:arylsulfatase A-like enzyme/Flp pilus assembly protein TadD
MIALGAASASALTTPRLERQQIPDGIAKLERIAGDLNVLVVTIDTLRADRLGSYGYSRARTPVLDALASSGARFDNTYALQPVTLPSHTTLFTGTHPARHRIADNGLFRVPDTATTLAELLKDAGVSTGAIVASFALHRQFGLDQGFEWYDDSLAGGYKRGAGGFDEMNASSVTDQALSWIAQHADERWLLWTHFFDPHAEYEPPPAYHSPGEHPYDGEVAYVDFELGRILDDLERRGLKDRTLVIVTSDHGESLGEHGELTHGMFLYDSVMRVPLLVSLPGTLPPDRVVSQTTSLMDITPTVLSALGIPIPEPVQGRSLVPLLFADVAAWQDVPLILETQVPWHSYGWSPSTAIVDHGLKFIDAPKSELYDLERDPNELTNLLKDAPRRGDAMASELIALRQSYGGDDGADDENAVALDEATRDRLASLGYIFSANGAPTAPDRDAPDVKDMVPVLQRIAEAALLRESGREDEALGVLESVVETSPNSPRVLNRLGIWYARRKDFDNAERHFKHLLEVEPEFIEGYENLALMYANGGRHDDAVQLAEAALSKWPRSARSWGVLGIVRLYEKDYRGALEPLNRAIEYYPAYHEALSNRGVAHFFLQDFEAALDDFRLASQIAPDNASYAEFVDQTERALAVR